MIVIIGLAVLSVGLTVGIAGVLSNAGAHRAADRRRDARRELGPSRREAASVNGNLAVLLNSRSNFPTNSEEST